MSVDVIVSVGFCMSITVIFVFRIFLDYRGRRKLISVVRWMPQFAAPIPGRTQTAVLWTRPVPSHQ